eukprot:6200838-Pleurochrysis_carterae.AAC.2
MDCTAISCLPKYSANDLDQKGPSHLGTYSAYESQERSTNDLDRPNNQKGPSRVHARPSEAQETGSVYVINALNTFHIRLGASVLATDQRVGLSDPRAMSGDVRFSVSASE